VIGVFVELGLTTDDELGLTAVELGTVFIPSWYDTETPGYRHVEHRFELVDQESAGKYKIDGSVSDTVTFSANALWCVCSQQQRRMVRRSMVVHILVDGVLFDIVSQRNPQ
jgi:hypothetical protein